MKKLYETKSSLRSNRTTITYSEAIANDDVAEYGLIRLDESIFFPEEGGQYADTGTLTVVDACKGFAAGEEVTLLDGQIEDGVVTYKVTRAIPVGTIVDCRLDWDKRFMRMQNHSGEHVLTGVVHNRYGLNNCGFHLSDDDFVTLDFDGVLSYEQIIEMEKEANRIIYENVPIIDSYPTHDELLNISYRSKIEIEGQVRLITIGDDDKTYDVCACCAPHVDRTGEIGIIKVISVVKFKKGIQVSILCGERALDFINNEHSLVTKVARDFSTSPDNIPAVIKSHTEEIAALKIKLSSAVQGRVLSALNNIKDGDPKCVFSEDELTANDMKNIYNEMVSRFTGYVGVFCKSGDEGYRFNAGGKDLDARLLSDVMREKLSAKGGGSAEMIQGRVAASKEEIESLFL